MKSGENNIDNLFKNAFEGHQMPPNSGLWDKIEGGMEHPVDDLFKDKLAGHEQIPSASVWTGIKASLPLNLYVRRTLQNLSKVAAVLLVGVALTIGAQYTTDNWTNNSEFAINDITNSIAEIEEAEYLMSEHCIDNLPTLEIKEVYASAIEKEKKVAKVKVTAPKKVKIIEKNDPFYITPPNIENSTAQLETGTTEFRIETKAYLQVIDEYEYQKYNP